MPPESTTARTATRSPTPFAQRATYLTPANSFKQKLAPVPTHRFDAEREAALDPSAPSRFIELDLGPAMGLPYSATTPHILTRYVVLQAGTSLASNFAASAEIYYVIVGSGRSRHGEDTIEWKAGDVFCFPGGGETIHESSAEPSLLLLATDEPTLAFLGVQPSPGRGRGVTSTHFRAETFDRLIREVHAREGEVAGKAILCQTEAGSTSGTITPAIVAGINTLEPGGAQRPHRHNGAAITLSVQGDGCHSMIDDERVEWLPYGVMVTPPCAMHSHHNLGSRMMNSFVLQDSGLHYHSRTVGFAFGD